MKLYNVKVSILGDLQKNGEPKRTTQLYSVWAETVSDGETQIYEFMKSYQDDFEVASVTETKVIDVIGEKK